MNHMAPIDPILETYPYESCYWFKHSSGGHFLISAAHPATIVVLHCGASGSNLYGYMLDPTTNKDDELGTLCSDGKYRRQVSIHFAWDPKRGDFVQMLPLTRAAWHVGKAKWQGKRVQEISVGIEGAGPPTRKRSDAERMAWYRLLLQLKVNDPRLELLITHARIDKTRKDPGENLNWDLFSSIPYTIER